MTVHVLINATIDYIPVRYIGMYQSLLGISWGLGYVVGALVGKRKSKATFTWDLLCSIIYQEVLPRRTRAGDQYFGWL